MLKTRKDSGSLGFRDLTTMNGKQTWRLAENPNALWSKILKGLYFNRTDLWHAVKGSRPIWRWQSLLMGRNSISKQVMWLVGAGENVNI